jgi:hypothetical protein
MMQLPDGRRLDLSTSVGVAAYSRAIPNFVSASLRQVQEPPTSAEHLEHLKRLVRVWGLVGNKLPEDEFANVALAEKHAVASLAKEWMQRETASRNWQQQADIGPLPLELFALLTPWARDRAFVQIMFEPEGVLVAGCALLVACKKDSAPGFVKVLELVVHSVWNCCITLDHRGGAPQDIEAGYAALEATGAFAMVLRGALHASAKVTKPALEIVSLVSAHARLIRKRFCSGTPTGDVLTKLCQGSQAHSSAGKLRTLKAIADLSSSPLVSKKVCRSCSKEPTTGGPQLMACSTCKQAHYCNATCQKADWKHHKKICTSTKETGVTTTDIKSRNATVQGFIIQEMYSIREALRVEGRKARASRLIELCIVIDFTVTAPGKEAGSFEVVPVADILAKRRLPLQQWFYPNTDVYESNLNLFCGMLIDTRDTMQRAGSSDVLLVAARLAEDSTSTMRVGLRDSHTGVPLFSDADVT